MDQHFPGRIIFKFSKATFLNVLANRKAYRIWYTRLTSTVVTLVPMIRAIGILFR